MKKIQIIAMIAAFVFFISGYTVLSAKKNQEPVAKPEQGKLIFVVVANEDLAPYTTVTDEMVSLKKMVISEDAKGGSDYYSTLEEVVGSVCIADVFAEEVVTEKRIIKNEDIVLGLASRIASGKRAVTIEVDVEQGVANNLKVGNRVDLLYTTAIEEMQDGAGGKITAGVYWESVMGAQNPANSQFIHHHLGTGFSVIALQDLNVIALGDVFFFQSEVDPEAQEYLSVTLEATPEQSAQIMLMNEMGKIQLALRPQYDDGTVDEPSGSVLSEYMQMETQADVSVGADVQ